MMNVVSFYAHQSLKDVNRYSTVAMIYSSSETRYHSNSVVTFFYQTKLITFKEILSMAYHPLNLGLRFVLELIAFFMPGYWAWTTFEGFLKYVLCIALPIAVATLWGVFAVPNDPSRSGKTVVVTPGIVRLILELLIFASAAWFIVASVNYMYGVVFTTVV